LNRLAIKLSQTHRIIIERFSTIPCIWLSCTRQKKIINHQLSNHQHKLVAKKRSQGANVRDRRRGVGVAAARKLLSLQDELEYLGGCAKAGEPRIRSAVIKVK